MIRKDKCSTRLWIRQEKSFHFLFFLVLFWVSSFSFSVATIKFEKNESNISLQKENKSDEFDKKFFFGRKDPNEEPFVLFDGYSPVYFLGREGTDLLIEAKKTKRNDRFFYFLDKKAKFEWDNIKNSLKYEKIKKFFYLFLNFMFALVPFLTGMFFTKNFLVKSKEKLLNKGYKSWKIKSIFLIFYLLIYAGIFSIVLTLNYFLIYDFFYGGSYFRDYKDVITFLKQKVLVNEEGKYSLENLEKLAEKNGNLGVLAFYSGKTFKIVPIDYFGFLRLK